MLRWLLGRRRAPASGAAPGLAQAYAQHRAGRLEEARAGYRAVLERDPGNYDAEYMLGVVALQSAQPAEALAHFERAVALAPQSAAAYNSLAEACRQLGRLEPALQALEHATRLEPSLAAAQFNLGGVLRRLGRNAEAIEAYRRAIAANPDFADAHSALGLALRDAGELDEALACAQRALALSPASVALRLNAANLLREKGFLDEAAAAYRSVLELKPDQVEALNNLGNVLRHQGRSAEALACYEQALTARPDFAEALLNAAQLMRESRRYAEAVRAYRLLIELRPGLAEAHLDLGNALKGMGDTAGARASYGRALEADPDYAEARWALAMSYLPLVARTEEELDQGREAFDADLAALERWCDERGPQRCARAVGTQQPFFLAYQEVDHRERLARYGALCGRLMGAWQEATGLPAPVRITRGQMRVGIASAHIHDHSVWNALIKGWLRELDPGRVELCLFHLGGASDVETALAKSRVAHYVHGRGGLGEWMEQILAQQLDVLIYPEIGMDPLTAKLAGMRLAPVQAASWGHPLTTGLPTIDYFLSAEALEPAGAETHYTERLVRLAGLGCSLAPSAPAPAEIDLRTLGVREGVPILVCAGTPFKYTPRHDAVLVDIARRLGECQFVFFTSQPRELGERLRHRLESAFTAQGLKLAEFAAFVPWQNRAGFHALLRQSDVYLDTMGFSGFNTALQAIECGLPVVAYEGHFLRGRLASGILRHLGLHEWVTSSDAHYVELAARLAQDAALWGIARERLEAARPRLYGDAACARDLEAFFEGALSRA